MWPAKTEILLLVPLLKMYAYTFSRLTNHEGFTGAHLILGFNWWTEMGRGKGTWSGENDLKKSPGAEDLRPQLENNGDKSHFTGLWGLRREKWKSLEQLSVVCGLKNCVVTEDITVAKMNFTEFLQWPVFKDSNDKSEDDFSQYSTIVIWFLWQLARDESHASLWPPNNSWQQYVFS